MILLLLYGLRNISFFDFMNTVTSTSVYPYLIAFILLLFPFILIERRAEDPVLNLGYFTNSQILITLTTAFVVGACLMGMVFVPQFAENALKIPSGSGGYFVAVLGVFAGVAAPLSGKLIDKYGPKAVMITGFLISIAGGFFLAFVSVRYPNMVTVCASLVLIGLGLGFVMGAPLNYMMLANTRGEDANSALATLSLIRSVGTIISPAIMIGFIAQAGMSVQGNLMDKLPPVPTNVKIVQAEELSQQIDALKANPKAAEMLKDVNIPDFKNMGSMNFDMNSEDATLPEDILKSLKSADVTNITDRTKLLAARMFDDNVPPVIKKIQDGVQTGMDKMKEGLVSMDTAEADMKKGVDGIVTGLDNMNKGYAGIATGIDKMKEALKKQDMAITQMKTAYKAMKQAMAGAMAEPKTGAGSGSTAPAGPNAGMPGGMMSPTELSSRSGLQSSSTSAESAAGAGMSAELMPSEAVSGSGMPSGASAGGGMPAGVMPSGVMSSGSGGVGGGAMSLEALEAQIGKLTAARSQLAAQLKVNTAKKEELENSIREAESQKQQLIEGISQMEEQKVLLASAISKMEELKQAVPAAFDKAKAEYLEAIEKERNTIEGTFQSTINVGYKQMYLFVAIANILALLILFFYRPGRKQIS
jgi:hypothetical protein